MNTNFGSTGDLEIDGSPREAALLRWDLTSIPAGVAVLEASLTLQVFDPSNGGYDFYALARAWTESEAFRPLLTNQIQFDLIATPTVGARDLTPRGEAIHIGADR